MSDDKLRDIKEFLEKFPAHTYEYKDDIITPTNLILEPLENHYCSGPKCIKCGAHLCLYCGLENDGDEMCIPPEPVIPLGEFSWEEQ